MDAVGVPMRTLQEWMGATVTESTTERYAHYAPSQHVSAMVERACASSSQRHIRRHNLSEPQLTEQHLEPR